MTNFIFPLFKRFSAALLATTALGGAALAQSFPDISPEEIARDVEKRYDQRTGETEYIAASFDPFEVDTELVGSASLRSARDATTIDGEIVSGGAFLDIAAVYTTDSPDSFDVRGFEEVDFMSGLPAGIIKHDSETLDCSRSTREVTYDDGYDRGASYGYIAGIYRIFPRYRGHRHYGWNRGQWRRGHYGTWRRGHGKRTDDGWRRRRGYDGDDVSRRRRGGDDDVRRRRRGHDDDGVTRRRSGDRDVDRRRRRPSDEDVRRRRRGADGDGPRRRRSTGSTKSTDAPIVYRRSPNVERATGKPERRSRPAPRKSSPPVSRPRREQRVSPQPRSRPASKPAKPAVSRPAPAKVNRAVDRAFKQRNPGVDRSRVQRNYYPSRNGYSRTDVYVNYRCVKEETLRVHIPAERLDAARFDGFAVMLIDNAGREVPVFVPPNYVEGFRLAAGKTAAIRPSSVTYRRGEAPRTSSRVSSSEPIIYGDPGYPQD